jgi:signal transduction histidine kinase
MAVAPSSRVSRRLLVGLVVFGLFVLFDIGLFGWLIFRSLSEREIEKILLDTRADADALAENLTRRARQERGDLYTTMAISHEDSAFIESVLSERDVVMTVEVRDKDGTLVYRHETNLESPPDAGELSPGLERPPPDVPPVASPEGAPRPSPDEVRMIEVPIGDGDEPMGSIRIGVSTAELEERVDVLRRDLVAQASVVGGVTLLLLFSAFAGLWLLLKRSLRLEQQAAEAERMAYVGTLASGLAHEIRNPLNSLHLNMQMLGEELADEGSPRDGSSRRLLSITRSEIQRLERLVTDFLAYAKPRPLELQEVPPGDLLAKIVVLVGPEARRRGVQLDAEDASDGARLWVDPAQIKQLLLNLVQNALAAIQDSGRDGHVHLSARRRGSQIELRVADDGPGIPEASRDKVFDLFYSTKKGGTGLGLAIVQRIVHDHEGQIEIGSAAGEGTSVTVVLPAVSGVGAPAPEALQTAP